MSKRRLASLFFGALTTASLIGCQQSPESGDVNAGAPALPASVTSKDFGDYVVHFNALPTDQLTADIAKSYGIVRSPNRAMLTVSIIKKVHGGPGSSVSGSVSASASNLTGQLKQVAIREIKEGEAVYYVGELAVANRETLMFNVDVTPINEASRFTVRFQRQFFTD